MSDDEKETVSDVENEDQGDENHLVDTLKLQNLLTRRKVYGDITQNVSERQIKRLLVSLTNHNENFLFVKFFQVRLHLIFHHNLVF